MKKEKDETDKVNIEIEIESCFLRLVLVNLLSSFGRWLLKFFEDMTNQWVMNGLKSNIGPIWSSDYLLITI